MHENVYGLEIVTEQQLLFFLPKLRHLVLSLFSHENDLAIQNLKIHCYNTNKTFTLPVISFRLSCN